MTIRSFYPSTNAQPGAALTEMQMRRLAPSIFAEAAHGSRSDRYTYIPTAQVLQGLAAQGFHVYNARQTSTRGGGREAHTKHMVRIRHASQIGQVAAVGDSVPEVILINSHDGSSSYKMMGGVFRYVCANGMTVPEGICSRVSVRHSGDVQQGVLNGAFEVLDGLTRVIEHRDAMRGIALSTDEQRAFAESALLLRYEPTEGTPAPLTADSVLRPRRPADQGPDLWRTFNRVQENLLKGGIPIRLSNGARTTTRAIKGIDQDVKLNQALWTLAEAMRKLKS